MTQKERLIFWLVLLLVVSLGLGLGFLLATAITEFLEWFP